MTDRLFEQMQPYGIFGLLFLFLLLYILFENRVREKKYQDIIKIQTKRETEYQVIIKDYQHMTQKHQEIIDDYNKKELNFQNIIQQLMNQIPMKLKKDIKNVEDEVNKVKTDVSSIKSTLEYEIMSRIKGN